MSGTSDKGRRVFRAGPEGPAQVDELPSGSEEGSGALEEMSFSAHIVSLHATALLYLGEVPDEGGQSLPPDKEAARHLIDTLDMLKRKTRGNLTPEETNLLDGILYELRVKFVQCK
jgi:hypothetical protein